MASNNNVGSTALVIAAWFVAGFLALKYLPALLRGGASAAQGALFGPGGLGGPLTPAYPSYTPLPWTQPVPVSQALQINGLTPDSAQALATIYNAGSNVVQPNGSPLTAGQLAALTPQYDSSTDGDSIPSIPFFTLPNSDYPTFSAGDDPFGNSGASDAASGDFNPDNYEIDASIPYGGE